MIDWRPIREVTDEAPFHGEDVLLAVPCLRRLLGGGVELDRDRPFLIYIGQWDSEDRRWCTTEAADGGDPKWLEEDEPVWWAELTMPPLRSR